MLHASTYSTNSDHSLNKYWYGRDSDRAEEIGTAACCCNIVRHGAERVV
jgi:hypothetical protein